MHPLSLEIEDLKRQLNEEQTLHASQLQELEEDRRVREQEMHLKTKTESEKVDEILQKL